jgi:MFS family permease
MALLMAFCFLGHINRLSMRVAGDERLLTEFCLTPTQIGTVYSAFLFAYTLCMIPGGWVIDRWGPKTALVVFGLGSAVLEGLTGLGGLGFASSGMALVSFLVIRAMMGMANAPLHPGTSRMVPLWIPPRQHGWANGLLQAAAGCGIAGVTIFFGYLIDWVEWRSAFLIVGTLTGLLTILWIAYASNDPLRHASVNQEELEVIKGTSAPQPLTLAPAPILAPTPARLSEGGPEADSDSPKWWRLLTNRSLVLLTVSYGAVGYFEYLFFYWMNYYFAQVLRLGQEESRFYSSIPPLAMVVGMVGGGWVSDAMVGLLGFRRGRKFVPVLGMTVGAAMLYVGVKASTPAWIVLWFSLALGAIGATEGPFWSTAVELGGRRGGTAGGLFNTGGNIGGLLAPLLTPWVAQYFQSEPWVQQLFGNSWRMSLYLGSLVCFLGVVLWIWIDPGQIQED